jgi:ABC-type nickel/cobalt efflux system permease component RcnA
MVLRAVAVLLVLLPASAFLPAIVSAHPLGNFTINHYAEIRVGERLIQLDVVIDMAEIPAFSEQGQLDTNHDGTVSNQELATARVPTCTSLQGSLALTVDGAPASLRLTAAGLELLPGAGGLHTLRTVCELDASISTGTHAISFEDRSYADRIGWREIVVSSDDATVSAPGSETATISRRLTHYPTDLLTQPPDERSVTITSTPGGPVRGAISVPDAQPLNSGPAPITNGLSAAVPGGVGDELSLLIGARDLTPIAVLGSLLIAAFLGALHALSPGHGKTVMAAYLVGTQGRARHAIGLALSVTVSHTMGVVVLAGITLLASDLVPPERLYPILGLASGLGVVGIGAWLLLGRWRQLRLSSTHDAQYRYGIAHDHGHPHDHGDGHGHPHLHGREAIGGSDLSWRRLVALGLAGGLVPSASALILLLGAIAAGRPAYGLALSIAFGVGMAVVLGGIGLALSQAGRLMPHAPGIQRLARFAPAVPWVTACVVLVAGVVLTSQALVQRF